MLPEGITIQSDRDGLIEKAIQRVYPLIAEERPITAVDYMERLKATKKEEVPVDFEKRFEAFMQTLRERGITGSEATNLFLGYKHAGFFSEELETAFIGKTEEDKNRYLESILMRRKDKSMYMFDLQDIGLQSVDEEEQKTLLESLQQGNGKYVYRDKKHTIPMDEGR